MTAIEGLLERYRSFIPEPEVFREFAQKPARTVAWRNPIAVSQSDLTNWMEENCAEAVQSVWSDDVWRLPPGVKAGRWPLYMRGGIFVQDETSLIAASCLEVKPGQSVLDLCAAPGGKSARVAVNMNDSGFVVANELSAHRIVALRRTIERMLLSSVQITHGNGVKFPADHQSFDAVIADVPCTCEGTTRKQVLRHPDDSDKFRSSVIQTQKALLRKALKVVRSGGTVLYATCTYCPEENEAVIHAASRTAEFEVIPAPLPQGIVASSGLTSWQGEAYRPDLENAVRMYPHQNDTGGFFFACLRKI